MKARSNDISEKAIRLPQASSSPIQDQEITESKWRTKYIQVLRDTWAMFSIAKLKCTEPVDFYNLFVDEEILEVLVLETNKYIEQKNNKKYCGAKTSMRHTLPLTFSMGTIRNVLLGVKQSSEENSLLEGL